MKRLWAGTFVVASVILLGGFLWAVAGGEFWHEPQPFSEYLDAVTEGDAALAEQRICDELWTEILGLDGGFESAREQTFRELPGRLQQISRLRGGDRYAAVRLWFEGKSGTTYFIEHDEGDRSRFCPPSPSELLGSPQRPEPTP